MDDVEAQIFQLVRSAIGEHASFNKSDPLMGIGLDSLQALQLIDDIGAWCGSFKKTNPLPLIYVFCFQDQLLALFSSPQHFSTTQISKSLPSTCKVFPASNFLLIMVRLFTAESIWKTWRSWA